jgi:hypothetical protein
LSKINKSWSLLLVLAFLLASCSPSAPAAPTLDANAIFTAAAQTADARMAQNATLTPAQPQATATNTPLPPAQPVVTPTIPLPAPTAIMTPTAPVAANPTAPPAQNPPPQTSAQGDVVQFVADVTVPDDTDFAAGEEFVKTWRLNNIGSNTWTTAYSVVFVSGEQMGAANSVPLPIEVAPGKTVDISVNMVAPKNDGSYTGFWMLRNESGKNFGIGTNADQPFYVKITVGGEGTTTSTQAASSSSGIVSNVSVTVDNDDVTAKCPYEATFTAKFKLSKAATVSYGFEASAENGSSKFADLPDPDTVELSAGTHTIGPFTMTFDKSIIATIRLRIVEPEEVYSNPLTFGIYCH